MSANPSTAAKAAMVVYDQWEREWVTRLQKNDKAMTRRAWLWSFVQVAENFRAGSRSTTASNSGHLRSDESSVPSVELMLGREAHTKVADGEAQRNNKDGR